MSECPECASTGWLCDGNCLDPKSHKKREDCKNPLRCGNCYYRTRKRVEHYDNVTGTAKPVAFTCGHGVEYTYEDARPCGVCRERAEKVQQAVETCNEHNKFINDRRN